MLISITDLIKKTINLYKENFHLISSYLLILILTGTAFATSFILLVSSIMFYDFGIFSVLMLTLTFIILVFTILLYIGFIKITNKAYHGEKLMTMTKELKNSFHLIIPTAITYILFNALISLCLAPVFILNLFPSMPIWILLVLIIVGVILAIFFEILLKFSYFTIIIDEHKIIQSFKTSISLVKNRWWGTFGRLLATTLLFTIILSLIQFVINIPTDIVSNNIQGGIIFIFLDILLSLISVLVSVFFFPLIVFPMVILYEELKKTLNIKAEKKPREKSPKELPKL